MNEFVDMLDTLGNQIEFKSIFQKLNVNIGLIINSFLEQIMSLQK